MEETAAPQHRSTAAPQHRSTAAPQHRSTAALHGVGGLLLMAAGLKLAQVVVSPVPSVGWWSDSTIQMAAVVWETILGLWLLSGVTRTASWLAALVTFTVFAILALMLTLQGVASCGCFGVLKTSPWQTLILDLVVLGLLVVLRPTWRTSELTVAAIFISKLAAGALALLAIGVINAYAIYGSIPKALAKLRNQTIVAPAYVEFGSAAPNAQVELPVTITNYSDKPINLIGGTADCSCLTTSDMPIKIGVDETITITIKLKVPSETTTGKLTRTAEIWTDRPQQRTLKFTIGASIAP